MNNKINLPSLVPAPGVQADFSNFYRDLKSFTRFEDCIQKNLYQEAPADWVVLMTDIKGSTHAIQNGRYQDVNLAGASAISAVLNAGKGYDLPYIFGGDGSTILIPPELEAELRLEMARLKTFIDQKFNLDLRVGFVPIADLKKHGTSVLVARHELSPGNFLAMFDGTGLRLAEEWLKQDRDKRYQVKAAENDELPNLEGLSCRWESLKSANGVTVTIMVAARDEKNSPQTLKAILDNLNSITGGATGTSKPTQRSRLKPRWLPKNLGFESGGHARAGAGNPVWILFQALMVKLSVLLKFRIGPMDPERYMAELELNTDYRKFDSMLRLVLDCTPTQLDSIEKLLYTYQDRGLIDYGLHSAESALMTCLVFSLDKGQHIHFVDGAEGGYVMCALALKNRINQRRLRAVA